MSKMSYIEAIQQAQDLAMEHDNNVFILGEDVGRKGGVFGATRGLQDKYGVERVIDTPLAESNIVGTAIGTTMIGKRPIAEIHPQILYFLQLIKLLVKQLKCAIVQIMTGNVLSQSEHPLVVGYMVVYIILKVSRASLRLHRG